MSRISICVCIGIAPASVNSINAGCCGNGNGNDDVKPLQLGDIKINIEGVALKKLDTFTDEEKLYFNDWCNLKDSDIPKDVVFLKWFEEMMDGFIFVCSENFFKKQPDSLKNGFIKKLGNIGYYISVLKRIGEGYSLLAFGDKKNNVKIEVVNEKKGEFKIVFVE